MLLSLVGMKTWPAQNWSQDFTWFFRPVKAPSHRGAGRVQCSSCLTQVEDVMNVEIVHCIVFSCILHLNSVVVLDFPLC